MFVLTLSEYISYLETLSSIIFTNASLENSNSQNFNFVIENKVVFFLCSVHDIVEGWRKAIHLVNLQVDVILYTKK